MEIHECQCARIHTTPHGPSFVITLRWLTSIRILYIVTSTQTDGIVCMCSRKAFRNSYATFHQKRSCILTFCVMRNDIRPLTANLQVKLNSKAVESVAGALYDVEHWRRRMSWRDVLPTPTPEQTHPSRQYFRLLRRCVELLNASVAIYSIDSSAFGIWEVFAFHNNRLWRFRFGSSGRIALSFSVRPFMMAFISLFRRLV